SSIAAASSSIARKAPLPAPITRFHPAEPSAAATSSKTGSASIAVSPAPPRRTGSWRRKTPAWRTASTTSGSSRRSRSLAPAQPRTSGASARARSAQGAASAPGDLPAPSPGAQPGDPLVGEQAQAALGGLERPAAVARDHEQVEAAEQAFARLELLEDL